LALQFRQFLLLFFFFIAFTSFCTEQLDDCDIATNEELHTVLLVTMSTAVFFYRFEVEAGRMVARRKLAAAALASADWPARLAPRAPKTLIGPHPRLFSSLSSCTSLPIFSVPVFQRCCVSQLHN
jgi:hypothetical protein